MLRSPLPDLSLFALGLLALLPFSGCLLGPLPGTRSMRNLPLVSTRKLPESFRTEGAVRIGPVTGESSGDVLFGVSLKDTNMQRAIDNALEKAKADYLTDVVHGTEGWTVLWLYFHSRVWVRGMAWRLPK